MTATLTMEKRPTSYIYRLHIHGEKKPRSTRRGKNYTQFIKVEGQRMDVIFNEYILQNGPYKEIPMVLVDGCWEMQHTYKQLPGNASAGYAITGLAYAV